MDPVGAHGSRDGERDVAQVSRLLNARTAYGYDNNGNLTSVTDPLNHQTANGYDALNRVTQVTDPANGVSSYGYDPLDQLRSVQDPRNLATIYTVDALGTTTTTQGPDTAATVKTYDAAGNVLTSKDAKNQTTQYQYEALNRVTLISFEDATTRTFQYDTGTNQKGQLTKVIDGSGSTAYTYNLQGRLTNKIQAVGTVNLTTSYAYDTTTGRLTTMTYPSGAGITYTWTNGQITKMESGVNTVASAIVYQPFGVAKSWTFGNGQVISRSFDLDGRMTGHSLGTIGYDDASRITSQNLVFANRTYGYDALDRVTSYVDLSGSFGYGYDANGNRALFSGGGGPTYTYTTDGASNHLASYAAGGPSVNYAYDANGSVSSDGINTYGYNAAGRLSNAAAAGYTYNGLDQRVKKVAPDGTKLFVYDEAGQLIGEYGATGTPIEETTYLGDIPLTVATPAATYWIHTDHLNAPRKIFNASSQLVWQWDFATFGSNLPNENPSGLGVFSYNLRFSGQYFDAETGLFYNYYRDYDPRTGRYVESDPIGLIGGLNTYNYVEGNPISYVDPIGLWPGGRYSSADAAGIQAIKDINPQSIREGREYAGRVYQNKDSWYSYTEPNRGTKDRSDAGVCPSGTTNVGDYHTHGADDPGFDNENFSRGDKRGNDREGVPGYLGVPSGDIKKYTPIPGRPERGAVTTLGSGAR